MKALIVDDSVQARKLLRLTLEEISSDFTELEEAENATQALVFFEEFKPDIVFLDIDMPGKNGIQLIEDIKDNIQFEIIFITAYNEYAIEAFRLSAVDYLLKPFREKDLREAIQKAKESIQVKKNIDYYHTLLNNLHVDNNKVLTIPINYGYEYLKLNEILYIEAKGAYSNIHLQDKAPILVSKNLKYFETILCPLPYYSKVNRSTIINLLDVKSYFKKDRGIISLHCGKEMKLSENYNQEFREKMQALL